MRSKVFVVNDSGHDYSKAEEYGELKVLTTGIIGKFQLTVMFRLIEEHLRDSTPDDYILMSGPSVIQSVACSMFATIHGCLNLLIFKTGDRGDRGSDMYILRRLNLASLKKGELDDYNREANVASTGLK